MSDAILSVKDLKVYFPMTAEGGGFFPKKVDLKAVDGVSLISRAAKPLASSASRVAASPHLDVQF